MVGQDGLLAYEDFLVSAPKLYDLDAIVMSDDWSLGLPLKVEASTDVRVVLALVLPDCRHFLGYTNPNRIVSRLDCLKWTC